MAADTDAAYQRLREALNRATRQAEELGPAPEPDRERFQALRQAIREVNTSAKEYGQAAVRSARGGRGVRGLFGRF